jgi:hypothetical protein
MKHIIMSEEHADKWLTALRSDEYEQGSSYLCSLDEKYCCLGLLQKVLDGNVETNCNGSPKSLPSKDWLAAHGITFLADDGVIDIDPYLPYLEDTASYVNDAGATFNTIANAIEKTLETY